MQTTLKELLQLLLHSDHMSPRLSRSLGWKIQQVLSLLQLLNQLVAYTVTTSSNSLFSSSSSSSSSLNWVGFARLLCGVIGIFGIAGAHNLVYIYTLELFPTVVRNAALGLATQAAGIGAVIAPTIVALDHYNSAIPFGLFAAAALVGALLALWLPETLNQPLWETLQGMENASTL
jgi:OCT family organic cation transporter-like MFS transporter 4/5